MEYDFAKILLYAFFMQVEGQPVQKTWLVQVQETSASSLASHSSAVQSLTHRGPQPSAFCCAKPQIPHRRSKHGVGRADRSGQSWLAIIGPLCTRCLQRLRVQIVEEHGVPVQHNTRQYTGCLSLDTWSACPSPLWAWSQSAIDTSDMPPFLACSKCCQLQVW
ncbi:hypothetical protein ACQKWADRAFT_294018 [Trichoderma austrokoningii]